MLLPTNLELGLWGPVVRVSDWRRRLGKPLFKAEVSTYVTSSRASADEELIQWLPASF